MKYLFFDTETNGLPRDYQAPLDDFENWPRMVQLAFSLREISREGQCVDLSPDQNYTIRPDGWIIPPDVVSVHGITTEAAMASGIPVKDALEHFSRALSAADVLVAHNMSFDKRIVGSEIVRLGWPNSIPDKPTICTMKQTTAYCRIPGRRGIKWPTLSELHGKIFSAPFEDAHSAMGDVNAMVKCFVELIRRGVAIEPRAPFSPIGM